MKKAQKKFKPELVLGGDEIAAVDAWSGRKEIYIGKNKLTPAQALRMAEWLKDAVAEVKRGKK